MMQRATLQFRYVSFRWVVTTELFQSVVVLPTGWVLESLLWDWMTSRGGYFGN